MPTTFAQTIDGNEILAKRSQCDYAGADIQQTYATKSEVTTGLASKQDTISDLATIRSGAADGATAVQPGDLATVATTGSYSDLSGTPTIPPALSAGNGIDITNNVVSADLDGTSLTNGANGLSVTLPVPDTTGASQGDVLSVGQNGIEWVTPGGGGGDDAVLTYNVSTWSDFTTAYNAGKNIRVVNTVDGATYEAVLFEYNPNGSPYGYAKFTATVLRNGVGAVSSNWYQISNIGSGVWTLGAGTIQGNYSGQGAISVNSSSHAISLTLDGSSLTQSSSGLAVANPLPSTLGTAGQVLQVNSGATGVEWATPSGGSDTVFVTWDDTSAGWATMWTQVQAALSDNKNVFLKDGFCIAELISTHDEQVRFRGLADSTGVPPIITYNSYTLQPSYAYKQVQNQYVLPYPGGGSTGQLLGLVSSNDPPYREPSWVNVNQVPASTSSDANKVLTVDSQGTPAWATPAAGGVTDVEVDGTSVVSGGVASITMPTVDQTYNSASTDAQSGVAVAGALSTKQDTISDLATIRSGAADGATAVQPGDLATVATSGSYNDLSNTPTILPYKPVVAGTGVRIVDDTANNRIVVEADETVLWSGSNTSASLSESYTNFERIRVVYNTNDNAVYDTVFYSSQSGTSFTVNASNCNSTQTQYKMARFSLASQSITFNSASTISFTDSGFASRSTTSPVTLIKVVGVNRIASN